MALNKSEEYVLNANNEFTKDLYKILAKGEENVFFSPLSLHAVLSMAQHGAGGTTKESFAKTLHIDDEKLSAEGYNSLMNHVHTVPNLTLLIANKVFIAQGFNLKPSYKEIVVKKFLSDIESVNFGQAKEAAEIINGWVNEKTKEKIPTLFEESDLRSDTALILANAIYFKGRWKKPFNSEFTYTEPFFVTESEEINCQMMHQLDMQIFFKIDMKLRARIAILPYIEEDCEMAIILPIRKNTLADVEARLANMSFTDVFKYLDDVEVDVSLPKFKIEQSIELNEPLSELGLGEIFESGCDLSGMLDSPAPLRVSKVIQKAFVEVNEKGAEAAAATGTERYMSSNEMLYANHPFFIVIGVFTKPTTKILFCGKVTKPISGDSSMGPVQEPKDYDTHIFCFRDEESDESDESDELDESDIVQKE